MSMRGGGWPGCPAGSQPIRRNTLGRQAPRAQCSIFFQLKVSERSEPLTSSSCGGLGGLRPPWGLWPPLFFFLFFSLPDLRVRPTGGFITSLLLLLGSCLRIISPLWI
jgi:hypothetical protein